MFINSKRFIKILNVFNCFLGGFVVHKNETIVEIDKSLIVRVKKTTTDGYKQTTEYETVKKNSKDVLKYRKFKMRPNGRV